MPIAERIVDSSSNQQRACLQYKTLSNDIVCVEEDTALVDGIGGTTWEGALVLSRVLEGIAWSADNAGDISHCHVLEIGCGTGLVGLVANSLGFRVTLSDRVVDLAEANLIKNSSTLLTTRKRRAFSRDCESGKNVKHRTHEIMHSVGPDYDVSNNLSDILHIDRDRKYDFEESIKVLSLPWGSDISLQSIQRDTFSSRVNPNPILNTDQRSVELKNLDEIWGVERLCNERGCVDIVVGAEITCLRKQHPLLVETIVEIARRNPKVVILLTFDGFYNSETSASIYEKEFIERMKAFKFRHSLISQAEIHWKSTADNHFYRQAEIITQNVFSHSSDPWKNSVVFPRSAHVSTEDIRNDDMDVDDAPSCNQDDDKDNIFHHHVLAFYLSDAVHTCQRCHREFFAQSNCRSPSCTGNIFNSLIQSHNKYEGCRFHSGMYVCRRHPGETRCSINGLGDQLGYYGNGQEGWKAEFWDCCGSEDPQCEGCCSDRHIPF